MPIVSLLARKLLDFLLPQQKEVRFLEDASPETFLKRVRPAPQTLPGVISLFDYRDPLVKTMIWQIKFKGNRHLVKLAALLMYDHLVEVLSEQALFGGAEMPLLLPVPLAAKRLRERGFNQSERITEEILALDGGKNFSLSHAVERFRETESQTKSRGRVERLKNLLGAFSVTKPSEVVGRYIIVLDDVATTGATIGEIKKVLMEAGAADVTGLTLAH